MVEQGLWKIMAVILAVVLMFAAPMMVMYDRQEAITYSVAYSAVSQMCDQVRNTGVIEPEIIQTLTDQLNATGIAYDIQLEHYSKIYVPIYDESTGIFTGDYFSDYMGKYNADIYDTLEGIGTYNMSVGDLFFIQIENKDQTLAQRARGMIFGRSMDWPVIIVRNGGMVRHEPD